MKIKLLDPSVYNQISAGEVVENPASAVKELVENSIDAGATEISVFIEDGGIKSIQVIDNGQGIAEEDLPLAIMPHATSKLFSADELSMISTLGFRGEALASISSVSTVELKSIKQGAEIGAKLIVKGGEIVEEGPVALDKGTNIAVKGLFFNTPARYKFLKSKKTEEGNVTKLISELILSNPDISIKYYVDGKLQLSSAGEGLYSAVESIYGPEIIDDLIGIDSSEVPFNLKGFIGKPASKAIKNNRNHQTFIINGRLVTDARISATIQNAYGEALMKKTFPIFILELIMPFEDVDINVHPGKKEVRFANQNRVCGFIYHSVKEALRQHYENNQISLSRRDTPFAAEISDKNITQTEIKHNTASERIFSDSAVNDLTRRYFAGAFKESNVSEGYIFREPIIDKAAFSYEKSFISEEKQKEEKGDNNIDIKLNTLDFLKEETLSAAETPTTENKTDTQKEAVDTEFSVIGQLFDTYILIQTKEELLIVDQHAAHERMIYDSFVRELSSGEIAVQEMLIPHIYQIEGDSDYLLSQLKILREMGFYIEEFGSNFLKVDALPLQFADINIDKFLDGVAQEKARSFKDNDSIKDILARTACRSAIKGGRKLSKDQLEFVVNHFLSDSMPLQCPHGRPVVVKITRREIEKMFGRIV